MPVPIAITLIIAAFFGGAIVMTIRHTITVPHTLDQSFLERVRIFAQAPATRSLTVRDFADVVEAEARNRGKK